MEALYLEDVAEGVRVSQAGPKSLCRCSPNGRGDDLKSHKSVGPNPIIGTMETWCNE